MEHYSINFCKKNNDRFLEVGFPNLERNYVFFDRQEKNYLKFYSKKTHCENERKALLFYEEFDLAPPLVYEAELCNCIGALQGTNGEECCASINNYYKLGLALKKLHTYSLAHLRKQVSTNNKFSNECYQLERMRWFRLKEKILSCYPSLWEKEIDVAEDLLLTFFREKCYPIVLCHNDYCSRNVLFFDGRISGIIDFEKASFSDPAADLSTIIIKEFRSQKLLNFFQAYSLEGNWATTQRVMYYALFKAFEIVTWAEKKDNAFFTKAVDFLTDWELLYDFLQ